MRHRIPQTPSWTNVILVVACAGGALIGAVTVGLFELGDLRYDVPLLTWSAVAFVVSGIATVCLMATRNRHR